MKISPLNIHKTNFKSTTRTTYVNSINGVFTTPSYSRNLNQRVTSDTRMINSNSTNFFRKDLDWEKIGRTFNKQFPHGKVNVYDFACSDGSEAYSLIITLIEQLGEKKAQRFFPIIASDIDPEIIRMANSGKIIATEEDVFQMKNIIKNKKIEKYFNVTNLGGEKYLLSPKEILTRNVIFKQESIKNGTKEIQKNENNIILARNFWKYMSFNDIAKTSWELAEKSQDKTLLLIGDFDFKKIETPFFLADLGFIEHNNSNKNILKYDKDFNRPNYAKDYKSWEKYVFSKYCEYIPSYLSCY